MTTVPYLGSAEIPKPDSFNTRELEKDKHEI